MDSFDVSMLKSRERRLENVLQELVFEIRRLQSFRWEFDKSGKQRLLLKVEDAEMLLE